MEKHQEYELDDDLSIDLEDQYFLPNSLVSVKDFLELVGGINQAYINWLEDELLTYCLN